MYVLVDESFLQERKTVCNAPANGVARKYGTKIKEGRNNEKHDNFSFEVMYHTT